MFTLKIVFTRTLGAFKNQKKTPLGFVFDMWRKENRPREKRINISY